MENKFIIFTIVQPKEKGKNAKIYYLEKNHFTNKLEEAKVFNKLDEAYEVQKQYDFNLYIDKIK